MQHWVGHLNTILAQRQWEGGNRKSQSFKRSKTQEYAEGGGGEEGGERGGEGVTGGMLKLQIDECIKGNKANLKTKQLTPSCIS